MRTLGTRTAVPGNMAEIVFKAGYQSEAAFNRAFKREFGQPPERCRSDHRALPVQQSGECRRVELRQQTYRQTFMVSLQNDLPSRSV